MKKESYLINNLNCGGCALKIETALKELKYLEDVRLDFLNKKLTFISTEDAPKNLPEVLSKIADSIESGVSFSDSNSNQKEDTKNIKKIELLNNLQTLLALVLFIIGLVFVKDKKVSMIIFSIAYLLVGWKVIFAAIKNILKGNFFDEHFLMSIATIGAFAIGEYSEGVGVMLFYRIGEFFQDKAVNKSRGAITELMNIRPDFANLKTDNGITVVDPNSVKVGDIIIVKTGEKLPLDGIVVKGEASLDTSALTGESLPQKVSLSSKVLSGSINKNGLLEIKVTANFGDSTISKILTLVEEASSNKAKSEQLITKFAKIYTPIVVITALLVAIIPPLFVGNFTIWLSRALIFLVISCPCALVISIPLSFFSGIGAASKMGVLIKGGNFLEVLNSTTDIIFDKTGTLTQGNFNVEKIIPIGDVDKNEFLKLTCAAEHFSNHPIAQSIVKEGSFSFKEDEIKNYTEIEGRGVSVEYEGNTILAGNIKLLEENNISVTPSTILGTVVYVANNSKFIGYIVINDLIKPDSRLTMDTLKGEGINTYMLTGDNKEVAESVANKVGISTVFSELLPQDKVTCLKNIKKEAKGSVLFVGDGINDAPVLALADAGIAMGGIGSDAAIEAADIVLMTDEPKKILDAIQISKSTHKVVFQNIYLALGIKIIVMIFGVLGLANMWEAIFADVGVSILAILNASRMLKHKK